jgi:hypothetical protein
MLILPAAAAANSGSQPSLHGCCFLATVFRRTQHLTIESDALEPIVQAEEVGETHAAMHFRG